MTFNIYGLFGTSSTCLGLRSATPLSCQQSHKNKKHTILFSDGEIVEIEMDPFSVVEMLVLGYHEQTATVLTLSDTTLDSYKYSYTGLSGSVNKCCTWH